MKNLVILISILFFTIGSYAQIAKIEEEGIAVRHMHAKQSLTFEFPKEITDSNIEQASKYYTKYFTVNHNAGSRTVKIDFIDNSETAKKVVTRFLLSSGVKGIEYNKETYTLMEFYDKVIKTEER